MGVRITKRAFMMYEDIRRSGATNMFDIRKVIELSDYELTEAHISYIMKHYKELAEKYL